MEDFNYRPCSQLFMSQSPPVWVTATRSHVAALKNHLKAEPGPHCCFGCPTVHSNYNVAIRAALDSSCFWIQFKVLVIAFKSYMVQGQIFCEDISPCPTRLVRMGMFQVLSLKCCHRVRLQRYAFWWFWWLKIASHPRFKRSAILVLQKARKTWFFLTNVGPEWGLSQKSVWFGTLLEGCFYFYHYFNGFLMSCLES